MSFPNMRLILANSFTLLIFILSFVKSVAPDMLPFPIFNPNISRSSEGFDLENCPPFMEVEHGDVIIKDVMGQTAAFITCEKNYTLNGKHIILCLDGDWKLGSDTWLPKCKKRCPPPPYLENGNINLEKKLEDVYSPTGSYLQGTVVTYSCKEGYILEPSSSYFRVCKEGIWTGVDAFCKPTEEVTCSRPPSIENGYMQPNFPIEYSPITAGQEVLYHCLRGYTLVGSDKIRCTENGIWLPELPTCRRDIGEACKKRWANLRTVYVRKKSTPKSGSAAKKEYYLNKYMQFLLPHVKLPVKSTGSNLPALCTESPSRQLRDEENIQEDALQSHDEPLTRDSHEQNIENRQDLLHSDNSTSTTSTHTGGFVNSARTHRKTTKSLSDADQVFVEYFEAKKQKTGTDSVFPRKQLLLSLLPEVTDLPETKFRMFKRSVFGLLDNLHQPENPASFHPPMTPNPASYHPLMTPNTASSPSESRWNDGTMISSPESLSLQVYDSIRDTSSEIPSNFPTTY